MRKTLFIYWYEFFLKNSVYLRKTLFISDKHSFQEKLCLSVDKQNLSRKNYVEFFSDKQSFSIYVPYGAP